MRHVQVPLRTLSLIAIVSGAVSIHAAPITGGSGPGGVGLTTVVSDLRVWLVAGDLSQADGSNLTTWNNRVTYGGAPGNATVANTAPTFENGAGDLQNNQPVVDFSGGAGAVGDVLTGAGSFTAEKSFFIVARQDTAGPGCCDGGISTAGINGVMPGGGSRWMTDFGGGGATGAPNPVKLNQWGVFLGTYKNAAPNLGNALYVDGDGPYSNSATAQGVATAGGYLLGSRATNGDGLGRFLNGQIAEAGVFNGVVSSVQRSLVENYQSSKYDLAILAADDHYSGDTLAKGHFDFDVFGIGNDSTSSVTSSGHKGLGIENNAISSGQWALAGHATGSNGTTTADLGNNFLNSAARWERSWYIDTTGSLGPVDLAFDWQDALNTGAFDPSFNVLYYRSSNSGVFQILAYGIVDIANQRVDFSGVTLSDEFYYTLGSSPIPEPSTFALLCLGGIGIAVRAHRRRNA